MESAYSGKKSIELDNGHPYGVGYVIIAKIAKTFGGSTLIDKLYGVK